MEAEWLEAIVKKHENDRCVLRFLGSGDGLASAKGENYLSVVKRVKLDVMLCSGRKSKIPIIIKGKLDNGNYSNESFVEKNGLFKYETQNYSNMLTLMENIMEEAGDIRDKLWPDFIGCKPYSFIVLKDLSADGFQVADRLQFFDLKQGLMVINGLARFHAMSKVLLGKSLICPADFKRFIVMEDRDLARSLYINSMIGMSKEMLNWDGIWKEYGRRFLSRLSTLADDLGELTAPAEDDVFNVVNHGDPWICNILFKQHDITNEPVSVRFIDYQICHYSSLAWDIIKFMATSLDPSVRRSHYNEFLELYVKTFNGTLDLYEYKGRRIDLQQLIGELNRLALLRLPFQTVIHTIMTSDMENAFDLDVCLKGDLENSGTNMKLFQGESGERFRRNIGPDIEEFAKNGLI